MNAEFGGKMRVWISEKWPRYGFPCGVQTPKHAAHRYYRPYAPKACAWY